MKKHQLKFLKSFVSIMSTLSAIFLLCGCTDMNKRNVLYEYGQSLNEDMPYWEAAEMSAQQLNSSRDAKQIASYLDTITGYMDKIEEKANARNASISDPEIKEIDDSYVAYVKELNDGYKQMKQGVATNDESMMNLGIKNIELAMADVKKYVNSFKAYTEKYNIKTDADIDELIQQFEAME